jgi:methyl-accepting chemotaxis protein
MSEEIRGSINRRMTLTVMLTTGISLFLACVSFWIYDFVTIRDAMTSQATTLARVIGINSAVALSFDDAMAADETLSALSVATPVEAAVIYDKRGKVFASYKAPDPESMQLTTPIIQPLGLQFRKGHLDLFEAIRGGGKRTGTIYIRWSTQQLASRMQWYATIVAALLATMIFVVVALANRLQRHISEPLLDLVRGAKAIAGGDLATEVNVASTDEIGALARTFNAMSAALRGLVTEVRRSTSEVSVVSHLLEDAAESMSEESQRQKSAISEVSDSIAQATESIHDVNTSVDHLVASTEETSSSIVEMEASIVEVGGHMDHLGESIDSTAASVKQVAGNTDEVVKAVGNLQTATDGSLTHLSQLTSSVEEVKANAESSHTFSEDSCQEAAKGMTAVRETMETMYDIQNSFEHLQGSVSRLEEKSQAIDEILKVIGDVAERTSLLSLNAAIIAAQAGEQGKAFSVVSGEVSNLADRTHRSTREIATLILAVQKETETSVAAVNDGSEKVEQGVQRSNVAGAILRQISDKSQKSTERVRKIVEATNRQSGDLQRVDDAINEVKLMVEQINLSTRDQHRATAEIANAIEIIRSLGMGVRCSTDEQRQGSRLITNAMLSMSEMVAQISEASKAQAASSEAIEHSLHVFHDISEESTRRADNMNTMVSTLSQRSQKLEREMDRFKTE